MLHTDGSQVRTALRRGRGVAAVVLVSSLVLAGCGRSPSQGTPVTTGPQPTDTAPDVAGSGSQADVDAAAKVDWCGLLSADEASGFLGERALTDRGQFGCRWTTGEDVRTRDASDSQLEVLTDSGWESYVDDGFTPVPGIGTDAIESGDETEYVLVAKVGKRLVRVTSTNLDPAKTRDAARLVVQRI